MRKLEVLALSISLLALAAVDARDAGACGGCFTPPAENTQVAGHRMALSISQSATTLWDQLSYVGSPSSFAWVLPIKGQVEIGLSSDAMFNQLDALTAVTVYAPSPACCGFNGGGTGGAGTGGAGTGGAAGGGGGGVTVIATQVVGPYETVQLKASDPAALSKWLASHGYSIPADVQPIIAAYVAESFDFLAMKLVPGMGISAMKPVRVTTTGASPALPLRMVAAGVGATTPINLFVLGEGRYAPSNFPTFTIDPNAVYWDFNVSDSNYSLLIEQGIAASNGKGWLVESANPFSELDLSQPLGDVAANDPTESGYADAMGNGAVAACDADLVKLFGTINFASFWITRLHAELPKAALATDLTIGASADQTPVPTSIQASHWINASACGCGGFGGSNSAGGPGGGGLVTSGPTGGPTTGPSTGIGGYQANQTSSTGQGGASQDAAPRYGGCSASPASPTPWLMSGLALAGALLLRRRPGVTASRSRSR